MRCQANFDLGKVRYLLGGGGGGGLQRGRSSMKFWSNGGGSRLSNLWKSGEGHAFRYRIHKLCKISNTFSAVQGAQISKFPGGACPRTPLASECFHVHVNLTASLTPWFTTCTFSTVNFWQIFPNLDRILWKRVGTLVSHIHVSHIWSTPQHFLSELKFTEVRFLTKIRM